MSDKIPRRIIQTAKSRDLPPLARAAAANLKLLHPDWEYLLLDDADVDRFIGTEFPQYKRVFESFPRKIQRFDFFRYLAVFHFGGFYFDTDVFLSEPLTDLLPYETVFPFEELTLNNFLRERCNIDWELGNYAFGAAPGNAFLAQLVENCVRAQTDGRWAGELLAGVPTLMRDEFHVLNTTGPGMVTRTFAESANLRKDVHVLFPADVCDSRGWHQFGRYGIHLMEASWRGSKNFLARRIALYWENSQRRKLLAKSRMLGPTRSVSLLPA